jgi:GT2 family glycosyltransferase
LKSKDPAGSPLVWAVVTNWNGLDDTTECLNSLLASTYDALEVVVVDNGSTDESPDAIARRFPSVAMVRTGVNDAVTAAYNAGVQYGLDHNADYILMLNNDIKLSSDMTELLVKAAEDDPSIGMVTPKIYYYDTPDVIWFAGGKRSRFDFGAYGTREGERDEPENSVAKEVDYAWACGMLIRRAFLVDYGLFDTRFYLYYDDVDMSYRVQEAGYRIWYVPEAKMWHKVSHSTGSERFTRIWARSKMRLYRKHTRGLHQLALIVYAYAHGAVRAIFPRHDNMRIGAHPKAYMSGLTEGLGKWQGVEQDANAQ